MVSIEKCCRTRLRQARRSISEIRPKHLNCFRNIGNQKTGLPVLDHLAARAEVHRDDGHASGIGFDQDKSETFRDSVYVQKSPGSSKQFVLALHVHRSDIKDVFIVEVGFDLLPEIRLILDDTCNDQTHSAQTSNLDSKMNTFIRMDPTEENQVLTTGFLKRVQREVDAVIDRR